MSSSNSLNRKLQQGEVDRHDDLQGLIELLVNCTAGDRDLEIKVAVLQKSANGKTH